MNSNRYKYSKLFLGVSLALYGLNAHAGNVRGDIDYQYFRDFAENKGKFTVGASNIDVFDINGNNVGTMLKDIPMLDFSSTDITSIATLIGPQHITSVEHNSGYGGVSFGYIGVNPDSNRYSYTLVNRNNFPFNQNAPVYEGRNSINGEKDYHAPRLAKLVTEVDPIEYTDLNANEEKANKATYVDSNRYTLFLRRGSGMQYVTPHAKATDKEIVYTRYAYTYVIGGNAYTMSHANHVYLTADGSIRASDGKRIKDRPETLFDNIYGPMTTYGKPGDSGSGLFGWDNIQKKWVSIGVLNFDFTWANIWSIQRKNYLDYVANKTVAGAVNAADGQEFTWTILDGSPETSYITLAGNENKLPTPKTITATASETTTADATDTATTTASTGGTSVTTSSSAESTSSATPTMGESSNGQITLGATLEEVQKSFDKGITSNTYVQRSASKDTKQAGHWDNNVADYLQVNLKNNSLSSSDTSKEKPSLDYGRDVYLNSQGSATLTLNQSIDQGAGSLYFDGNFTVKGKTGAETWVGGGISVAAGKTVTLQVNGVDKDRLSKIGAGTLVVRGTGVNAGDVSIGDGTLVLDQQADTAGKRQAFNTVGIAAGRSTVVLNSADQVNPNNIYFSYRGGRLDVNGNSQTLERVKHVDDGAKIVNHNLEQEATITLTGITTPINKVKRGQPTILHHGYAGSFGEMDERLPNGKLNVEYKPTKLESYFLTTGGMNLNGNFTVTKGNVFLSGRPVSHAYDYNYNKNAGRDVIFEDEWQDSSFKANEFIVADGANLTFGRNVANVTGNFSVASNGNLNLGYKEGDNVCYRSEHTNNVTCNTTAISEAGYKSFNVTNVFGNINAQAGATVALGKATFFGTANSQANHTMAKDATWVLTGDSNVGNLTMAAGSRLVLGAWTNQEGQVLPTTTTRDASDATSSAVITPSESAANSVTAIQPATTSTATVADVEYVRETATGATNFVKSGTHTTPYHTLTIANNLAGTGDIEFRFDGAVPNGDKIVINGAATGTFNLNLVNTANEPEPEQRLTLIQVNDATNSNLVLNLQNKDYVDIGALRYRLLRENNQVQLYNPVAEKRRADRLAAEEAARIAEEKRQAEEAARLAEEKRQAEEKARLEAEAAKKAEEERLATEAAKKAEEERLAAEVTKKAEEERLAAQAAKQAEEARLAQQVRKEAAKRQAELDRIEAERVAAETTAKTVAQALQQAPTSNNQPEDVASKAAKAAQLAKEAQQAALIAYQAVKEAQRLAELARQAQLEAEQAHQQAQTEAEREQAALAVATAKTNLAQVEKVVAKARETQDMTVSLARQAGVTLNADGSPTIVDNNTPITISNAGSTNSNTVITNPTQAQAISTYANAVASQAHAEIGVITRVATGLNDAIASDNSSNSSWVKVQRFNTSYGSDLFRDFNQKATATEIGVASKTNDMGLSFGLVLNQTQANNSLNEGATSSSKLNYGSVYAKAKVADLGYFFTDAGLGHFSTDLSAENYSASFGRDVMTLGVGAGTAVEVAGFQVKGLTAVRGHSLERVDYKLGNMAVKANKLNIVNYAANLEISKDFEVGAIAFKPFASLSYSECLNKNFTDKLFANSYDLALKAGREVSYTAGIDVNFAQAVSLNTKFTYSKATNAKATKQGELKLTYKF